MLKQYYQRPLTPHLTQYFPEINSIFSILQRITGVILSTVDEDDDEIDTDDFFWLFKKNLNLNFFKLISALEIIDDFLETLSTTSLIYHIVIGFRFIFLMNISNKFTFNLTFLQKVNKFLLILIGMLVILFFIFETQEVFNFNLIIKICNLFTIK